MERSKGSGFWGWLPAGDAEGGRTPRFLPGPFVLVDLFTGSWIIRWSGTRLSVQPALIRCGVSGRSSAVGGLGETTCNRNTGVSSVRS